MYTITIKPNLYKLNKGIGGSKTFKYKAHLISSLAKSLEANSSQKTCVKVNYGHGYYNETLLSKDTDYLLFATEVFLEEV